MWGGQTGTLTRLMGLCQLELVSVEVITHTCSETEAMCYSAHYRWWELKMILQHTTIDNPIVCSIPWLM